MTERVLTDEQEQAVARRSEPLLLAAGAGSGKTSVLVERFVRAVREDGVAPGRILAITFTERAAGELRERVRRQFRELGEREAARDTEAAFVSTFHGFCARLLRAHPFAAGLDPEFEILDEGLAGRLRGQAFALALRGFLEGERSEAVDLVAAFGADRVRAMVGGTYAELRSKGQRLPVLPPPEGSQAVRSEPMLGEAEPAQLDLFAPASGGEAPVGESPAGERDEVVGERGERGEVAGERDEVDARGARACVLLGELLERFGRAYEALKGGRGALDFDDLELIARALLDQHESIRRTWAERFELLMVDEFQDTNPRQLAILTALERGNLFTVGDELQSIYGFRHADVSLFRARRDELAERGGSLSLTRNFRGRKPLLDAVNAVFAQRFGDGYAPLEAGRVQEVEGPAVVRGPAVVGDGGDRTGQGDASGGGESGRGGAEGGEPIVELLLTHKRGWDEDEALAERVAGELPPAPRWRQAEARLLAQRVAELVEGGSVKAGDVAVLLRAVGDLEVYERALQERGLRTLATVGGFWGGRQVGDLLAYLRALANPLDELALYGTLASPLVGVSSDGLALLGRAAKVGKLSVWETLTRIGVELPEGPLADDPRLADRSPENDSPDDPLLADRLPAADRDLLVQFHSRFQAERRAASRRTISQLIERALDQSGYLEHLLSSGWGERRLANVHKLLRLARRYEASEGRDLRGFLDHVAHQQDGLSGAEPDAPVVDGETDAVRLMSIHAAKGLEFGLVCVADLGRTQNLGVSDLLVDGDRLGLRLAQLDGTEARSTLDFDQLSEERRQAQGEEEERILYVAMTRARERLILSGAVDFERWPEQRLGAPAISWLGPALVPDLPTSVQTLEPPVRELAAGTGDGTQVRIACRLNAPATVGAVLRLDAGIATTGQTAEQPLSEEQPPSEEQDIPPAADPVWLHTLSYTALSELERCGYRYYLERVLGLAENRLPARGEGSHKDGLEARARGTIVHRLLESLDFARGRSLTEEDVAKVARELGVRVAPHERQELAALLRAALDTDLAARLAASRSARREYPFAFSLDPPVPGGLDQPPVSGVLDILAAPPAPDRLDQPLVSGVLDILVPEPDGGLLIVDYKSDRLTPEQDLERVVEREYSIQRLIYALAVLRDGAPRAEIVHWFLHRPSEPVGIVYTVADKPELEDRMAALIHNARAHPFIVSKSPHRGLCLTCPGRSGLCSWSDSDTLRERVGA